MHKSVMDWAKGQIEQNYLSSLNTLEVGSLNVNGSVRELFSGDYHGIDIQEGPGVDEVIDAAKIEYSNEYDVVICTEMLEHAEDWRAVVNNIKKALTKGGHLLLTARGPGFKKHDYPGDFWRFTPDDMRLIFSDMDVKVSKDPLYPGVFVFAKKTKVKQLNLDKIEVSQI